jgi:hypothetical protein
MVLKHVAIGGTPYEVTTAERDGSWIAEARKKPSGMLAGPPATAPTADEAAARLIRWLEWQHAHEDALGRLQAAEQAYHRAIAGSAFSSGLAEATEVQQEALQRIEDARLKLEEFRQNQPEI